MTAKKRLGPKWVMSVILCDGRRPVDFRYSPLATGVVWRRKKFRCANNRHWPGRASVKAVRYAVGWMTMPLQRVDFDRLSFFTAAFLPRAAGRANTQVPTLTISKLLAASRRHLTRV
jgi:hypothetical protein